MQPAAVSWSSELQPPQLLEALHRNRRWPPLVQVVATFVAGFATVTALVALAQVALAPDLHLRRRVEAWRRAGGAAAVSRGHGTCAVVGGAAIWRRSTPRPPHRSLHVVC